MESMVSSASLGVTSAPMLARPKTWICSFSPAARTASRSRREKMLQPEHQALASHGLLDDVRVGRQLIADGSTNQVGAIGVEPLLHQQVDLPEVDRPQVDGDLLGFTDLDRISFRALDHRRPIQEPANGHPSTIQLDGKVRRALSLSSGRR